MGINGEMFNADQRSWMDYLATLPKEAKCDCGWNVRGKCFGSCYGYPEKGGWVETIHGRNAECTCGHTKEQHEDGTGCCMDVLGDDGCYCQEFEAKRLSIHRGRTPK